MKKYLTILIVLLLLCTRLFYHVTNPKYDESTSKKVGFDLEKEEPSGTKVETADVSAMKSQENDAPIKSVPSITEKPEASPNETSDTAEKRQVYDPINQAFYTIEAFNQLDKKTLMHFKGIGEKTAEAILIYRKEVGVFKNFDELLQIKGIGEKKLASILLNSR